MYTDIHCKVGHWSEIQKLEPTFEFFTSTIFNVILEIIVECEDGKTILLTIMNLINDTL